MTASRAALFCITVICAAIGLAAAGPAPVRPLPFFYDLYTFRGSDGRTEVVAAYAVEAGRLGTRSASGGVRYRFSVSLVLVDTLRRSVVDTHDTVSVRVRGRIRGDHLLYTHVELPTPPSRSTRQRVLMYDATRPGVGQLYSEPVDIPDYSGDQLMLSDVALGQPDAAAGWTRGDATLALLPTDLFPSSEFDVYYEIYNLPAGRDYMTEIVVEHADEAGEALEGREPIVRLGFTGESTAGADGSLAELRSVETSLPRGGYRLTVVVTDLSSGESASRSRAFRVRGWNRGTTMVPALRERVGSPSRGHAPGPRQ